MKKLLLITSLLILCVTSFAQNDYSVVKGNVAEKNVNISIINTSIGVSSDKKGKKLQFLKSEIDEWMKSDKRKTAAEIHAEAIAYVNRKAGYEKFKK